MKDIHNILHDLLMTKKEIIEYNKQEQLSIFKFFANSSTIIISILSLYGLSSMLGFIEGHPLFYILMISVLGVSSFMSLLFSPDNLKKINKGRKHRKHVLKEFKDSEEQYESKLKELKNEELSDAIQIIVQNESYNIIFNDLNALLEERVKEEKEKLKTAQNIKENLALLNNQELNLDTINTKIKELEKQITTG